MRINIEDFKTGWYGLDIGLKNDEIDLFIDALKNLKQNKDHFHIRSDCDGSGGVNDIEFYYQDKNTKNNMKLDISPSICPENKNR